MSTATSISVGTLTIALVLIILNFRTFLKGGKKFGVLLPGTGSAITGSSAALCVGGAFGHAASVVAGAGVSAGAIVPWATGTEEDDIASGTTAGLTTSGSIAVFIIVTLWIVAFRSAGKADRKRMVGGIFCGICLTYTAGVAGLVDDYLIPAYNTIGDQVKEFFERVL